MLDKLYQPHVCLDTPVLQTDESLWTDYVWKLEQKRKEKKSSLTSSKPSPVADAAVPRLSCFPSAVSSVQKFLFISSSV